MRMEHEPAVRLARMRGRIVLPLLLVTSVCLMLLSITPAVSLVGDVLLCSSDASGAEGNAVSLSSSISGNGRYVAFDSDASNLVPGTSAGRVHVFRKDLDTGDVVLCSCDNSGTEGDDGSYRPSISLDGRYVAFTSAATNLVGGGTAGVQVFRKDLETGNVYLVSSNILGNWGDGASDHPSVGPEGGYVAFESVATNLLNPAPATAGSQVFRKDCLTGAVTICSRNPAGVDGDGASHRPSINGNGQYVAFDSDSTNLVADATTNCQVFMKNLVTDEVILCSADSSGAQGDNDSMNPSVTPDAQFVAFESAATNLLDAAPPTSNRQIIRKDLQSAETVLCSSDIYGIQGDGDSWNPSISADGLYVAFQSDSNNLVVPGTRNLQVFRKDLQGGPVAVCSSDNLGNAGDNDSSRPSMNPEGRFVSFESTSSNLVPAPTTGTQVFRKELLLGGPTTSYYFAEGTARPNFETYFCIQNPTPMDAEVEITYMKGDGTTETENLTVTGISRSTVNAKDTLGEGDDEAHDFSSRVVSTNDVGILVERPMYFNYREGYLDWTGGHVVMGLPVPRRVFYFAEGTTRDNIHDGSYEEWLCIQNPSDTDAATVDITYMLEDGSTMNDVVNVDPTTRETVEVNALVGPDHDVSVFMESDRPIVAERPMYFNYRNKWSGGHDVVGAPGPARTFYFAEGTTRKNSTDGYFEEWITIQNPNDAAATVDVTYYTEQAGVVSQQVLVAGTSRKTVDVWLKLGDDVDTSFKIDSDLPILVERPMYFDYHGTYPGGHDVMGCAMPQGTFFFAEGTCRPDFDTYLAIQNPESTDAAVVITYMKGDGTIETQNVTVSANSRSTIVVKDRIGEGDSTQYDFSSTVSCVTGQKIVVERPMYFDYGGEFPGGHDTLGL